MLPRLPPAGHRKAPLVNRPHTHSTSELRPALNPQAPNVGEADMSRTIHVRRTPAWDQFSLHNRTPRCIGGSQAILWRGPRTLQSIRQDTGWTREAGPPTARNTEFSSRQRKTRVVLL